MNKKVIVSTLLVLVLAVGSATAGGFIAADLGYEALSVNGTGTQVAPGNRNFFEADVNAAYYLNNGLGALVRLGAGIGAGASSDTIGEGKFNTLFSVFVGPSYRLAFSEKTSAYAGLGLAWQNASATYGSDKLSLSGIGVGAELGILTSLSSRLQLQGGVHADYLFSLNSNLNGTKQKEDASALAFKPFVGIAYAF